MNIIRPRDKNLFSQLKKTIDLGRVAAIPTDTVYGFITGTKPEAIQTLEKLKGHSNSKFAIMVSDKAKLSEIVSVTNKTQKLVIGNLLPGKVTLIMKEKDRFTFSFNGKVGLRIPDLGWLLEFLRFYKDPIIATSANRHDELPLRDVEELKRNFPHLDLIVNGGEIDRRASTVLDLTYYPPKILRFGALSLFEIDKEIKRRVRIDPETYLSILIVCTGNSCRSPMAVGILKTLLKGLPVFVYSAGTVADLGLPAADNAIIALRERNIDISNHQSQPLSRELVIRSDLILVMEKHHKERVEMLDPEARTKTFLLKEFPKDREEIFDPVGRPLDVYKRCLKLMIPGLEKVASFIQKRYLRH